MSLGSKTQLWYVHFQGQKLGPYHWEQVAQYFSDCGKPADFLVWTSEMVDWQLFGEVEKAQAAPEPAEPAALAIPVVPAPAAGTEGGGGLRTVETADDLSLSFQLRDSVKADPRAKAGAQPTKEAVKHTAEQGDGKAADAPLGRVINYDLQKEANEPARPQPPTAKPGIDEPDEGWLNMAKGKKQDAPESEPDQPLTQELNFSMPAVQHAPPVWVTILLAIGCGMTFHLYRSTPALPLPSGPFTLRCGYVVETNSGSSIRRRVVAYVAGEKFRVDTPQREEDYAIFDGDKLQLFKKRGRGKRKPKINLMENPNPMLMQDLRVWQPRNSGELTPTKRIAGRQVQSLVNTKKSGVWTTEIEEKIDTVQGVVLSRVETTLDGKKKLEVRKFSCRKVKYGPLPKGIFKP